MGERKVLNNYIPPDFDPSIIPRIKRQKDKLVEVRMMLPFSLRCNTCGEYMYRGKKFNSKSEFVVGDDYLGIRKLRFYIKCTNCAAEITFKTDPKNSDYECESGASRNFELWRDTEQALEDEKREREEEEIDPMKNLEHRTMDNKIEMDILDALDEMKAINQRHQRVDINKALEKVAKKHDSSSGKDGKVTTVADTSITEEEEEMIKSMFAKRPVDKGPQEVDGEAIIDNAIGSSASLATTSSSSQVPSIVNHIQRQVMQSAASSSGASMVSRPPVAIISRKRKADVLETATTDRSGGSSTSTSVATDKTTAVAAPAPAEVSTTTTMKTSESTTAKEADQPAAFDFLMGYGDDDEDDDA